MQHDLAEVASVRRSDWINPLGRRPLFPVLGLMLLASFVLIWANFNRPFYKFDDVLHLKVATENGVTYLFDTTAHEPLMPLSFLSLRAERALFGPSFDETLFVQAGMHAEPVKEDFLERTRVWATATRTINAVYHALAGWILWLFFRRLGAMPGVALTAALAWAVHPMACESVCWISERKNVLAALFAFGSLYAWVALRESRMRWPVVSFLYLLALLSKPTAVGFFPIYVLLEILDPFSRDFRIPSLKAWGLIAVRTSALLALTIATVVVTFRMSAYVFVERPGGSGWTALLTDFEIFGCYIGNVLLPYNLSFFYGIQPIVTLSDSRVWLFGAAIVNGCTLCIWAPNDLASRKRAILGVVWFFAALGPTSNIAPFPFWMQDRYAYFAAPGLLLAVAEAVRGLTIRYGKERFLPLAGSGFVALLTAMALLRSEVFVNAESLWADAAERQPLSGKAQSCMFDTHLVNARRARDISTRRKECELLNYYLQRAERCPDLANFSDEFEMHVSAAHAFETIGEFDMVLEILKNWVPPPARLKLSPPPQEHKFLIADFKHFYDGERMAFAHTLVAEALLMRAISEQPDTKAGSSATNYTQRIQNLDAALNFLNPSSEVIGKHPSSDAFDWEKARAKLKERILEARTSLEKEGRKKSLKAGCF